MNRGVESPKIMREHIYQLADNLGPRAHAVFCFLKGSSGMLILRF